MKGKVALITGSTSGIGLGIAHALASRGCDVILTGFAEPGRIESLKKEIKSKYNVEASHVHADLRQVDDINSLCQQVTERYPGGIHILINDAGFNHVCHVEHYETEKWNDMVAVMLSAPFHLTKYFIPVFRKNGWGRIVNISSTHGMISTPGKAVYSAVKHGIIGLTKGVALETAESGITCNAVCPTFVHTALLDVQITNNAAANGQTLSEATEDFAKLVPTQKLITVENVAQTVVFLCTDAASAMTGSCVTVDGGFTAQ